MAEAAPEVHGNEDGSGSSSQVEERKPKWRKITVDVWAKVRGGRPVLYHCEERTVVSDVLQNVKHRMPEKLQHVDDDNLQLFSCESDADDPSKACIVCMTVVCCSDCCSFDMWGARVAVAKVVILCCILGL